MSAWLVAAPLASDLRGSRAFRSGGAPKATSLELFSTISCSLAANCASGWVKLVACSGPCG